MVAFVASIVVLVLLVSLVFWYGNRRPLGTPLTWAEGMLGAVIVFAIFLLAYAVVPNQWLLWAYNQLNWRADAIAYKLSFWGRGTITVTKAAVADTIATVIYVVMLGLNIFLWAKWQKRGQKKEVPAIETSTFGRPLVRKA